jgi:pimeloyl-ACP methyl ester carboxylesterase
MWKMLGSSAFPLLLIMGVIAMFAALQRQMIYFPTIAAERELLSEANYLGMEPWRDEAGAIIGWKSASGPTALRRMLVFHGNAGYALHRQYYVAGLLALDANWEVFLFEYPGYGSRPGIPSAESFEDTAAAALELLQQGDERPVYLIGESLGSGVASYLAGAFADRVAGLLLVTPFTSFADVAAFHYPVLPVRTLLSERYDSLKALSGYTGPAAFLIAGSDEIVPPELGQQLHDSYQGPKWLRVESGAGHNSLSLSPRLQWWRQVSEFLLENTRASPSR